VIGAVGLAVLALELALTRDPNSRRTACRWWTWGVALLCQGLLIYFHALLDYFLDDDRRAGGGPRAGSTRFHRMYLWTCTIQWLACLLVTWWTRGRGRRKTANGRL